MFKKGDIVVCKNVPINIDDIYLVDMVIGNSYMVIDVIRNNSNIQMLKIIGENGDNWYWSDYFYNKEELRKIKIDKICSKKVIK